MVLYRVYSEPYRIKYYSTVCSRATLFQILVYCIVTVPPFFIAYSAGDFWQYTSTYREQADVEFLNDLVVQICDGSASCKSWSSYGGLNQLLEPEEIAIPVVKSCENDTNRDGVNDILQLKVEFSGLSQTVSSVQLMLFFQVKLSLFSSLVMQSLVHISPSYSSPSARLWVGGELALRQKTPLPAVGRYLYYNTSIFNTGSLFAADYGTAKILSSYQRRNITTVLENVYLVWESGTSSGNFTLEMELLYPVQTITYVPGFWQLVKFAWIQYLALLVVFWTVLRCLQSFVFRNQIILTVKRRTTTDKPHQH